jgi:hypothetical protein
MDTPKLGKYLYYDNGKIKPTCEYKVEIVEIIPFNEGIQDKELRDLWLSEVEEAPYLYAKETPHFLKGVLKVNEDDESEDEVIYFVQVVPDQSYYSSWFSLGFWGGYLDHSGKLRRLCEECYEDWYR